MRILINSINYSPELTGIGKYAGEMAEWLVAQGCEVRVITAPPYYPAWKISRGYSGLVYRREQLNGVAVFRCPLWVPGHPSGIQRIVHLATFALTSLPLLLWNGLVWRPNLVFVIEPPIFCAFGALAAGKLSGGDAWLHVQDFEVDAAFSLGILQRKRLQKAVESVERWLMRGFDRVSTISVRMLERLGAKGVPDERQVLFENWVDLDQIRPLEDVSALRRELRVPAGVTILLYSGNMGKKQGLELVIDAAKTLRHRTDLFFILCGNGVVRTELERMSLGYENVMFVPLQPVDRLNELLNLADIHLLPQRAGAEDLVMPSKLINILASGRPVVATAGAGSQIGTVVRAAGCVVEPGDLDGFVRGIERFADDADLRRRFGRQGREFAVKNLAKEAILSKAFSKYLANIH
jgi:colanic acid biosynthesis glycosyl transferase WcaI